MFTLIFIVIFGPKKGVFATYSTLWKFNPILQKYNFNDFKTTILTNFYVTYRFQFTILTCRTTTYILFLFWNFFYFFGESMLLLLFNFSTISDTIPSSSFFLLKHHTIFSLTINSINLNNIILFNIFFFLTCAILFLLNLKYSFYYQTITYLWIFDLIFFLIISYLLLSFYWFIFLFGILLLLNTLSNLQKKIN
jgi:hypothetical protein